MPKLMLRVAMIAALAVAAPSCGSRVETSLQFPPAADLQVAPEPPYPEAALVPGEAGQAAEDQWRDEMLIWGRGNAARLARVCRWAVRLGLEVPPGYCGPAP